MKKLRWIKKTHLLRPDEYICSVCGVASYKPYPSCPFCGTELKRSKHDESWIDEAEELAAAIDEDW